MVPFSAALLEASTVECDLACASLRVMEHGLPFIPQWQKVSTLYHMVSDGLLTCNHRAILDTKMACPTCRDPFKSSATSSCTAHPIRGAILALQICDIY